MVASAPVETVDLSSMTKAELIAYGQSIGVGGLSTTMLKADIIKAIEGSTNA